MNREEFIEIHDSCVAALAAYFVEAEKSTRMLGECTVKPLTFKKRFKLMSQGLAEKEAHLTYLGAKSVLYKAARLGYGNTN